MLPQAIKIESLVGRPNKRLKPKLAPKVMSTVNMTAASMKHPLCGNRRKADRGAEQHHGDFEELLRAERDAGSPSLGCIPGGTHRHPKQDGDYQCLYLGMLKRALLQVLEANKDRRDQREENDAGEESAEAVKSGNRSLSSGSRKFLSFGKTPSELEGFMR